MDSMNVQDISFIDIDELGVRPLNWIDDGNDIDFDDTTNGYFGKNKEVNFDVYSAEFQLMNNGKKLLINEGDASMFDDDSDDDSDYETDPETGKYKL
jgi:hypothetical protein